MALEHRRLVRHGKKNQAEFFCVQQVYFTKSCQHIWMRVNQPFIPFIHHIWGETVLWDTVFIIQTSDRMQYFTILQYKLPSFNTQDDRSTRGILTNPLKNFHMYGQPVLTFAVRAVASVWMNINRVKLQHNKEFIMFIFIEWWTRGILSTPASDVHWTTENIQTAPRLKLQDRLLTINKRNIIRWNIYRDNNLHSRRQVLKCL